ncbi:MAG: STAS-like domain-containing protein [Patescibacteria group bacterium]
MKHIKLFNLTGSFAENKDIAQTIRKEQILPALNNGEKVILDFEKIDAATQSFMHALISDLFRIFGDSVLDRIDFKDCSETVQKIIGIVVDYMQES